MIYHIENDIPIWQRILAYINDEGKLDSSCTMIAKALNITYSHTIRVLNELERRNIISTKATGRRRLIKLRAEGRELADASKVIVDYFG
jgi:DNA-binding MarR family transcriptional regulator